MHMLAHTDLLDAGLASADRSNTATLPRTAPRPQSSRLLAIAPLAASPLLGHPACRCFPHRITMRIPARRPSGSRVASSLDSGLEAFSHYPSDGSGAPLATPPRARPAIRTGCSSRTGPDYCCNAAISRVKLTCLTTV